MIFSKTIDVLLNLETDSNSELFTKIKGAIDKSPQTIRVEIIGIGHISQDMALAIWDMVLDAKRKGIFFKTYARSSLYDGSLLLLLMGDTRSVRPTAFVQIDSMKRLVDNDWSEYESKKSSLIAEPPWVTNYREVFNIINQFLPAEELADKRIPMTKLEEFGLLDNEEQEKAFQEMFYGKAVESPPSNQDWNSV